MAFIFKSFISFQKKVKKELTLSLSTLDSCLINLYKCPKKSSLVIWDGNIHKTSISPSNNKKEIYALNIDICISNIKSKVNK